MRAGCRLKGRAGTMAVKMSAERLSERMFDAALAVADEYHGGNADGARVRTLARAYSLAANALQERANLLTESE